MNVLDYLKNACSINPEKTVFADDEKSITYNELDKASSCVGTFILQNYCEKNKPIAVLIDRNVESICAFFGIIKSHNFYLPIDASQPLNRILTIIEQMKPFAVVKTGSISKEITDSIPLPVLDYQDICQTETDSLLLENSVNGIIDTDPLYLICTSGSTGVPKGVLISHRNVQDFIPVFTKTFGFTGDDVLGNQAPFDFDVSVKDIYSTLYLGASMYIIPKKCFAMPKLLVEKLNDNRVTTLIWAVSALCIISAFNAFKHTVPSYIKSVLFSGEVMPVKMLNVWRQYLPDAVYVNLYGPTEITCNCMYYIVDREFDNTEKLPLGRAFENERILVLNDEGKEVSAGETGEICVAGTCVGLGYYNNPERTASSFIQNPLNDSYPEIIYRTGDMAELKEDGHYYFAARKDFQIKHMGHRIELEEIETHLQAIDGVQRACCLYDEEKNKIVAFYLGTLGKNEIINRLKLSLPKFMIPTVYNQLDEMPLTKNGKIDRDRLRMEYFKEDNDEKDR